MHKASDKNSKINCNLFSNSKRITDSVKKRLFKIPGVTLNNHDEILKFISNIHSYNRKIHMYTHLKSYAYGNVNTKPTNH